MLAVGLVGATVLAVRSPTRGTQARLLLANPHRPWLGVEAWSVSRASHAATAELFGATRHVDDLGDAFRHAYGSALLTDRAIGRWGMSPERAEQLVRAAGRAHELDGVENPLGAISAMMDLHNNDLGIVLGSGAGRGWSRAGSNTALKTAVLDAMRGGRALVADDGQLVQTTRAMVNAATAAS